MPESWLAYSCRVREADVATTEACLEAVGALSVSCADGESKHFVADEMDGALPLWPVCEVTGLFAADAKIEDIETAFKSHNIIPSQAKITAVHDRNWHESWRDHFCPQRFGEDLWICPTWVEPPAEAALVVRLDPGMAFGTGNHATTGLCLEWLSRSTAVAGAKVLDYGCGTGIIGLAAAKLGAAEVTAVDIDDAALHVCQDNVSLNGLQNVMIGTPEIIDARHYDIIVANILLEPLVRLADQLTGRLVPGGHIVLSGILVEQSSALLAAYAGKYKMQAPRQRGDWALVAGVLNGP